MTSYKTCAVPMCRNTTIKCPNKLFIHVPMCRKRRQQWLQLARRDPQFTSDKSAIFFCEDHFDLPNDMENYVQYTIMGSIGKIKMKPDCLPSKFHCQPDRIKRTGPTQPRSVVSKRRRMDILEEIFSKEMSSSSSITSSNNSISTATLDEREKFQDKMTQLPDVMENHMQYKVMGSVKRIQIKPGSVPTKFPWNTSGQGHLEAPSSIEDSNARLASPAVKKGTTRKTTPSILKASKTVKRNKDKTVQHGVEAHSRIEKVQLPNETKKYIYQVIGTEPSNTDDPLSLDCLIDDKTEDLLSTNVHTYMENNESPNREEVVSEESYSQVIGYVEPEYERDEITDPKLEVCNICLEFNVDVQPLGEFKKLFILLLDKGSRNEDMNIDICSGCVDMFEKVQKFREKILRAQNIIRNIGNEAAPNETNRTIRIKTEIDNVEDSESNIHAINEEADTYNKTRQIDEKPDITQDTVQSKDIANVGSTNTNDIHITNSNEMSDSEIMIKMEPEEIPTTEIPANSLMDISDSYITNSNDSGRLNMSYDRMKHVKVAQIMESIDDINDTSDIQIIESMDDINKISDTILIESNDDMNELIGKQLIESIDEKGDSLVIMNDSLLTERAESQIINKKVIIKNKSRAICMIISGDALLRTENQYYTLSSCVGKNLSFLMAKSRGLACFRSQKYKCNNCVIAFKDMNALDSHLLRHSESNGDYKCYICKIYVTTPDDIKSHMQEHYVEYVCCLCNHREYKKWQIRFHFKNEHRQIIVCATCGMLFREKQEFSQHYKKNHQELICHHCDKTFSKRVAIKKHMARFHVEDFRPRDEIKEDHSTVSTNRSSQIDSSENTYCVECDLRFESSEQYMDHLNTSVHEYGGSTESCSTYGAGSSVVKPRPHSKPTGDIAFRVYAE